MSETTPTSTEPANPVDTNHAILRCTKAWQEGFRAAKLKKVGDFSAEVAGGNAYRKALPPLSGYRNIRDFVACVSHGIAIGAIDEKCGSKLLYAAQVALGVLRQKPRSKPASTGTLPPTLPQGGIDNQPVAA